MIRERLPALRRDRTTLDRQGKPGEFWKLLQIFYEHDGQVIVINRLPSVIFREREPASKI